MGAVSGILPADPAELAPWPTPGPGPSLEAIDDDTLRHLELALHLACGRSHTALKRNHRQFLCFMFRSIKAERERRNVLVL